MTMKLEKNNPQEKLGYKNHELLRFHIAEKIDELNNTIKANDTPNFDEITGDILASLIDILVVILFSDDSQNISCKIILIVVCVVLFIVISKGYSYISKRLKSYRVRKKKMMNETDSIGTEKTMRHFDNVAFDYLLLCHDYINKYEHEEDKNIKDFYYHEVIYYCQNSVDRFSPIYMRKDLYIGKISDSKIEIHRVDNFISILKDIGIFIKNNLEYYKNDNGFYANVCSLVDEINGYNKLGN